MKVWYIVGVCLVFAAAGEARGQVSETEYFAVFMEGKKVGHSTLSRVVADGKVTTTEKVNLTLSRAGVPISIDTTETSIETVGGKPLGFETIQNIGMTPMKIRGTVSENGMVEMTVNMMGQEQKSTFEWPSGAVMAEGTRLLELEKGLKEGSEYSVKVFSASVMQALDAEIHIGAKQDVDLLGRIVRLTEVTMKMVVPGAGEIVNTSYVDDELRLQKNITPVMGMQIEIIACPKEFALGENDVLEVIGKLFLPSPVRIENVNSTKSISYHLSPTGPGEKLTIPPNDNQIVEQGKDGGAIVTVKPVAAPEGATFPYSGGDKAVLDAMKPNRFLQSDRREIIELAKRAVGDSKDAAEAVRKIESFVAEYIESRNLSVGYASAVEVAASRQGDCSEHAVLAAAMCRAVGIPAQVVSGTVYVQDWPGFDEGFGGHAWVQAYVGGKWVGLDAISKGAGRGGYGPGHIALAAGDGKPEDFLDLLGTLGKFRIDKVVIEKGE